MTPFAILSGAENLTSSASGLSHTAHQTPILPSNHVLLCAQNSLSFPSGDIQRHGSKHRVFSAGGTTAMNAFPKFFPSALL